MTTFLSMTNFENVGSFLWEAAYSMRYELICGIIFIAVWLLVNMSTSQRRTASLKSKLGVQTFDKRSTVEYSKPSAPRRPQRSLVSLTAADLTQDFATRGSTAELLERLKSMDQKLLCDHSWLVPQVSHLCRTQFNHALTVYRAAMQAGLKLKDIPPAECHQLFVMLIASALRVSQVDAAMSLMKDLHQSGLGVSAGIFGSMAKICTSKQLFADCLVFYDFASEDANFSLIDQSVWSCLLFCAIEARAYQRCNYFFSRLKAVGTPSSKDYGNMIRLASLHSDWQLSLRLIQEMRSSGLEVDSVIYNTSLATCVAADQVDQGLALLEEMVKVQGVSDVITYNTLMKGYAKAGRMDQCFQLFDLLKSRDISPSQVTYGILLDGCINENLLDRAAGVFNSMREGGCPMNTVLFTTLIKGFARAGEVDQAMQIYQQMCSERSVPPDLITFSILIKANCDADRLDKALKLLESMLELGLKPDEVIFNNLLGGCARQTNLELGKRLYADMIASGIRPSNATFSILIRLYHQCKQLDEAAEMLRTQPAMHKVDPEPRLFLQLIQSCIRERHGRRAVDVYDMLLEHSTPAVAAHGSMIGTCVKLNMYDTAAEILAKAASHGGRVDRCDATSLLEGAVKKRKFQVGADIAASMERLGIPVDPKLLTQVRSGK